MCDRRMEIQADRQGGANRHIFATFSCERANQDDSFSLPQIRFPDV